MAFGETVADQTLTAMTADEAQGYADTDWGERWVPVATALREDRVRRTATAAGNAQPGAHRVRRHSRRYHRKRERHSPGIPAGVFDDADGDAITITAASSDEAKATVSIASDNSSLTVRAQARGTATITVTANDGNGGSVEDTFTVTVKAAPVVASAISDVSGLEAGGTQEVSLAGVFTDADGDSLTITASSRTTPRPP